MTEASPGLAGVTQAELDANTAPDTNATLVDVIEATWLEYIERESTDSIDVIVARAVENSAVANFGLHTDNSGSRRLPGS